MSKLINAEITVELAKDSIKEIISQKPNQITIPYIQEIVADYYSLNVSDFKAKKKNQAIAIPRQIAMYLSRKLTDTSFPKIGQEFGNRDHTTVLHAYEKITAELETNNELKSLIETLENKIKIS